MLEIFSYTSVWIAGGTLAICAITVAACMAHCHSRARARRKRISAYERLQRV